MFLRVFLGFQKDQGKEGQGSFWVLLPKTSILECPVSSENLQMGSQNPSPNVKNPQHIRTKKKKRKFG